MHFLVKAVKVITSGVTILKGELIKRDGAFAVMLGKVIEEVEEDPEINPGKKLISFTRLGDQQNRKYSLNIVSILKEKRYLRVP